MKNIYKRAGARFQIKVRGIFRTLSNIHDRACSPSEMVERFLNMPQRVIALVFTKMIPKTFQLCGSIASNSYLFNRMKENT